MASCGSSTGLGASLPHICATTTTLATVLNSIYLIAGALAVIFIIIGAIRYIIAAGNPAGITQAKNTITYAIVGLIIVLLAYGITNFVLGVATFTAGTTWTTIRDQVVNKLIYVAGLIGIVMLIVGGFRYTTSAGNAASITKAKNTVLGAVIGIVIAVLAYAIVNFVIAKI